MNNPDLVETGGAGEPPKLSVSRVKDELREVFAPNLQFFGHGTRLEVAPRVLEEGLESKHPYLDTTAMPLFGDEPFEEQPDEVFERFINWPHLESKAVVVIALPHKPQDFKGGITDYLNSAFEELGTEDTGHNTRYVLPSTYIRGYFNAETGKFVENPNFKPTIPKAKPNEAAPPFVKPNGKVEIPTGSIASDEEVW